MKSYLGMLLKHLPKLPCWLEHKTFDCLFNMHFNFLFLIALISVQVNTFISNHCFYLYVDFQICN